MQKTFYKLLQCLILIAGLGFASIETASGQNTGAVTCPKNLDWEDGTFLNWNAYTGASLPGSPLFTPVVGSSPIMGSNVTNPYVLSGPVANRHQITSATFPVDPYGLFSPVAPGGGTYSLKIGNDATGAQAERVRFYVHVPVGFNDYSFNFRFACVLDDPYPYPHNPQDQPSFQIAAYDSTTGLPVPCALQAYVADSTLLKYGFKNSAKVPASGGIARYLPWTGSALPIIGQGGKTITIDVTSLDCTQGGHFGYGYFDVISCGKYKAAVSYCNLDSGVVRFIGTGITQKYNWYTSNWTYIGQGAYIDAPIPSTPDFFYGVLANGTPGCLDTIKTDTVSNFLLNATPDVACAIFGKTIQLNTIITGGVTPFSTEWNANPELSCTKCTNPIASPKDTTRYVVTVTDRIGCFRHDTVIITQAPNAGPDLPVCPLGERPAELHVSGPVNGKYHWYEGYGNSPGRYLSCTDCTDPTSAPEPDVYTYTVGYEGCDTRDTVVVYHDTSNYIVAPQDDLLICRPTYVQLISNPFGPKPYQNLPCGQVATLPCLPADLVTATTANDIITPPRNKSNTPLFTERRYQKYQFIISKKDMHNAGFYSGTINSMSLRSLATAVTATPVEFVTVSLACVNYTSFPKPYNNGSFEPSLTQVANLGGYTVTPNAWNQITFDAPYSWDTTKNLLIEFCTGPKTTPDAVGSGSDPLAMTEGNAIQKYHNYINVCGGNTDTIKTYTQRPVVQFSYCPSPELPFDYTWRPGQNLRDSTVQNPVAYISQSINYAVYSVGRNGCRLRDSLHVIVPEHHLAIGPIDTVICQGQPAFLGATGGESYKWYEVREGLYSDASGSLSCIDCQYPTAKPMQTTTYAVVYGNETAVGNPANTANGPRIPAFGTGCPDTLTIKVKVNPLPPVTVMNADTTIGYGKSVQLFVRGAQNFTWTPVGSLNDPNSPAPIATPKETTTYVVVGSDSNGCAYRDTVKVTVNYRDNLLIPSGFTPNGDGHNDVFHIINASFQRLMEFRVFNRWGQEIFSTTDITRGWDGTWKGVPQEIGTYEYIIRVGYPDGKTELYKGDVSLLR